MTLTRYNEIMQRVKVTPEMRMRVLTNAVAAAAQPVRRRSPWKHFALAAACLALVVFGVLTLPRLSKTPQPTEPADTSPVQGGWDAVEFDSVEALSAAAGFPVREVPALASAGEKSCVLISHEIAQITCVVGDAGYCWRVSSGSEDNSGDYNEYDTVRTAELGGVSVTLKGDVASCYLALWEKGGFSYSLACDAGLDFSEMEKLVLSAMQP